jgi:HD-GYP domain-containing protein (c-di-GMP phosphodiesterase class II)
MKKIIKLRQLLDSSITASMSSLIHIDDLIESYDVSNDQTLKTHYQSIHARLWGKIEHYGEDVNQYGVVVAQHLQRTASIGAEFIKTLGFSERAAQNFYEANLLHDLGKTHFSYGEAIWQTPHRPTPEEREQKRAHTRLGVELLDMALTKSPDELLEHPHVELTHALQRYHHERVDGTGYEGVSGDAMGQIIKAICIIDAYDGDMIHRPHQAKQRTPEEALERLKNGAKYQGAFDEALLERFIDFTLQ